ncbi:nucleoside-diphosphate-sugar epimerase family protein [Massariosphaeria phaeospora]|uniref:Nucleoside-diphosphate-sugar epimerase family protein n=1 Tax=Massariosphaeria phaeospora TaxID=100035 RepID=A0A7C8M508_9PLEO|nr:nucleoside-diphosphate-sugar epimerase family protein [Massariosphaeria phaeospora]
MSTPLRNLLITGATGKQGGALLEALTSRPAGSPFHIYALTRDKTSSSAQRLAAKPNVSLVQGDLDNCPAIFEQIPKPWGVFSVQLPLPNVRTEEARGKALADAAAGAGVQFFVYTSVERGGVKRSDEDPTYIAHFKSKFNIEKHIQHTAESAGGTMQWSIIRPVAFYDNLSADFLGKAFGTMWKQVGSRPVQYVSSIDIGKVAALAFENPSSYTGRAISLAGDELNHEQAKMIFTEKTGKDMPETYGIVGSAIKVVLREQLGDMFRWFGEEGNGFGADIQSLRKEYPFLMDFGTWIEKESAWKKS